MFKRLSTIGVAILVLSGCSTMTVEEDDVVPEGEIVDIDPTKTDYERYGNEEMKPTPPHVIVGDTKDIIVEVRKREVRKDKHAGDIQLQIWDVSATNLSDGDKCITPFWRLMDFEYISYGPSEKFIRSNEMVYLGRMNQQMWVVDGIPIALAPSGYLSDLKVRDPVPDAESGSECEFFVDESNVEEK